MGGASCCAETSADIRFISLAICQNGCQDRTGHAGQEAPGRVGDLALQYPQPRFRSRITLVIGLRRAPRLTLDRLHKDTGMFFHKKPTLKRSQCGGLMRSLMWRAMRIDQLIKDGS